MSILCRHRLPIAVARRGKNELSSGFIMSVMCSRCQKDLGANIDGLPVLISYEEFMGTVLKRDDHPAFRRFSGWSNYL